MENVLGLTRKALDRARASRDPRFDGRFFIAVTSTRIYCRPVCPVPAPKAAHIRYYDSAAAAAEAGYRPCLRCRPEAAPGTPAWLGTSAVVRRALRLIEEGALDALTVEELAARLGIGPRHLHRLFVQHVGAAPITVAQTRRLHFAKSLLDETDLPMTEIAIAAGFGSLRRFNDAFVKTYGRPPREIRSRRRGTDAPSEPGAVVLRLAFRPPYDWPHALAFFAARAVPGLERVEGRSYTRALATTGGHAFVSVQVEESDRALRLRVTGAAPGELQALAATTRRVFDLAADPSRILAAFAADPLLGPLLSRRPGLRIPGAWDAFECAVRAILGQQVSVAAARTLAGRLVARSGAPIVAGPGGITHLFPTAAALAAAELEGLGLTGGRRRALQALGTAVADGRLDLGAPAEAVMSGLTALPGIGSWTAQYVALRSLSEPDAFPDGDLVLRRAAGARGVPLSARALAARAEAWRPWRGYAVFHLWSAAGEAAVRKEAS